MKYGMVVTIVYHNICQINIYRNKKEIETTFEPYQSCHDRHINCEVQRGICTTLTLKAPIMAAADDIHKYFSLFFRENKT